MLEFSVSNALEWMHKISSARCIYSQRAGAFFPRGIIVRLLELSFFCPAHAKRAVFLVRAAYVELLLDLSHAASHAS